MKPSRRRLPKNSENFFCGDRERAIIPVVQNNKFSHLGDDARSRRRRADAAAKRKARNAIKAAGYRMLTVYVTATSRGAVLRAIRASGGIVGLATATSKGERCGRPRQKSTKSASECAETGEGSQQSVFSF